MGCECVNTQHANRTKDGRVVTDFYTPTEYCSGNDFDPYEIQDKIDKQVQWELQYYAWVEHKGNEAERPPRPGPHPDPKHEWNTNPQKYNALDETNADDISDQFWSSLDQNNCDHIETRSDCQRSKIFFDL